MSVCSGQSLFGNRSQYIRFSGNDIIAVEGMNTVEKLLAGDIRIPYKQLLKSRIVLKKGGVNYLLNHLGLGDNATFIVIKATYNSASVNEEDNYILWNYFDDFNTQYPLAQILLLTGNSTNRIKQLYLTNPSTKYDVTLDLMVGSIDDTYNFFQDSTNQVGTSFTGLSWEDIQSFVVGKSIVLNDTNGDPLIYIELSNINSISRTSTMLTIDDDTYGTIIFVFTSVSEAAQAESLLNYVLSNQNINISNVTEDTQPPVVEWLERVGGSSTASYIFFNGSSASVPYDTLDGLTFSATISLNQFGPTLTKTNLINLLIDTVSDTRDGVISITSSAINLFGTQSLEQIVATGSYSMSLNISDIALNSLTGVTMSLTIEN
jgi:hypothetical protein